MLLFLNRNIKKERKGLELSIKKLEEIFNTKNCNRLVSWGLNYKRNNLISLQIFKKDIKAKGNKEEIEKCLKEICKINKFFKK